MLKGLTASVSPLLEMLSLLLGAGIILRDARMLGFKVCTSAFVHGPRFIQTITVITTHDKA